MPKQSKLISETTMYSINSDTGEIVIHHLPWPRTSPQLETYTAKGFTFERPDACVEMPLISKEDAPAVVLMPPTFPFACDYPGCDFFAKSKFGLTVHQRRHKKVKA